MLKASHTPYVVIFVLAKTKEDFQQLFRENQYEMRDQAMYDR